MNQADPRNGFGLKSSGRCSSNHRYNARDGSSDNDHQAASEGGRTPANVRKSGSACELDRGKPEHWAKHAKKENGEDRANSEGNVCDTLLPGKRSHCGREILVLPKHS